MSGIVLEKEPVDVGTYQFSYNIEASPNNGNYIFDSRTTVMVGRIVIEQQDLTYSLASNNLIYNGAYQHPLINNLHLANGNLPTGVSVNYTYRYSRNNEWIETNQIKDVGTYYLRAEINGGSNYPSSTLENLSVYIVAQDLRIGFDETNTQSQYLNDIVDYGKHLEFSGLVGNDKANDFYAPIVSGNVQSYYTIGSYPIFIDGFKLDLGDAHTYTKFDNQTIYEIGGLRYYKLELKNATEPGSLYLQLDEYGEYVYRTLINKFNNYNIYISIDNIYTIYPDGEAILVSNDTELQSAIAEVPENGRTTIYLAQGEYSKLYIDINASITIIGCYDENANIISVLQGIVISEGEVKLRIVKIEGEKGVDSIYIGDNAGMITILECNLDGQSLESSRAIVTSEGYDGLLYINDTTITRYTRAIEIFNGSVEITSSVFHVNIFGISSYTEKEVYIRNCDFTSTSNEALRLEKDNYIVLECNFSGNMVAINARQEGSAIVLLQNTFAKNGNDFKPL